MINWNRFFSGESEVLNRLFEVGLSFFHLRKPQAKIDDYDRLLSQIDKNFHPRIHVHEHFELADKYALGGVHFNSRSSNYEGVNQQITFSRSCHTLQELTDISAFDYVFLSPIFDSISKRGYKQGFLPSELQAAKDKHLINKKVIALGGISPANLHIPLNYSFGGIAVLGYIWQNNQFEENFIHINTIYQKYTKK